MGILIPHTAETPYPTSQARHDGTLPIKRLCTPTLVKYKFYNILSTVNLGLWHPFRKLIHDKQYHSLQD